MNEYSDRELIRLYKEGDNKHYAFNLIVRKYQQRLYWLIRRMVINHEDTDDLLQNTMIRVWRGLDGFRENSGLYTWIYRIAVNETLTYLKKKSRRLMLPLLSAETQLEKMIDTGGHFEGEDLEKKLYRALLSLPKKQRLVFQMKYFDDMKYEEMAEILKTSVGSLKASYHHAMKKIETMIQMD